MVEDFITSYVNLHEEFMQKQAAFVEQLRPNFHDLFKPFLDANPIVDRIGFRAYTPYFNDGDECVYGIHGFEFFVDGLTDDYEGFEDSRSWQIKSYLRPALFYLETGRADPEWLSDQRRWSSKVDKSDEEIILSLQDWIEQGADRLRQVLKASEDFNLLSRTFWAIPEDVIRGMFGDHVRVTITRDGVETEEYDHD